MNTRGSQPTQHNERLNQALRELARSNERGDAQYIPTEHGWPNDRTFKQLTETKEAKHLGRGAYRITLLGLTTYRQLKTERNL